MNARDRIGNGPWDNAKGQLIAANVAELHGDTLEHARLGNRINKITTLSEKGEMQNGVGDTPNEHDILTGSQPDGRAYTDAADHTCKQLDQQLGWNGSARPSSIVWAAAMRPGIRCIRARDAASRNLVATGGAGKLYCFAIN